MVLCECYFCTRCLSPCLICKLCPLPLALTEHCSQGLSRKWPELRHHRYDSFEMQILLHFPYRGPDEKQQRDASSFPWLKTLIFLEYNSRKKNHELRLQSEECLVPSPHLVRCKILQTLRLSDFSPDGCQPSTSASSPQGHTDPV